MNSIAVRSVVEMGYSNEQIMSVLQKINLSRQGIQMHSNYPPSKGFSFVHVAQSLVVFSIVVWCPCSPFCQLKYLSFDLRLLITPLVSSIFS
jgi:hypothetical protein